MSVEGAPETHDGVAVVLRGDTILIVYAAPARLHRTRWVFDQLDQFVVDKKDGILGLMLITDDADPPDRETRHENNTRMRRVAPSLRRVVTVPLGDAFWISIVRSVMRGIAMVQRQSGWNRIESTLDAGLDRLLETRGPDTPPRTQIIEDVRAAFRALGREAPSCSDVSARSA